MLFMNLLKLKAKVLLSSEEQMEVEDKYDFGNIAKSKEWVWRSIAVPAGEVYRIIEFNKNKSIVEMNSDEKILVAESFDELYEKWQEAKEDGAMVILENDITTSETSNDEEEDE